jgi:starch phosphorylase
MGELLRLHPRGALDSRILDPEFAPSILALADADVWRAHESQKKRLVSFARERALDQFARHGRSPDELRQVSNLLDPAALTLGFARRFATYKRASLIFRDRDRLRRMLAAQDRPVQILLAGKAHPADEPGRALIRDIFQASLSPGFSGRVLFLEDYDMRVARYLVQGVDVWINTPRRPLEASGTSGMKTAVNGGLNFSILDGWWCEGYDASHGWAIGRAEQQQDTEQQDREDAESFYDILEREIVPCYYRRDTSGLPTEWIARMKRAIGALAPRFGSSRMMQEYADKLYVPASRREGWGSELDEVQYWSP